MSQSNVVTTTYVVEEQANHSTTQSQPQSSCIPFVKAPGSQRVIRWVLYGLSILSLIFGFVSVCHCTFVVLRFDGDTIGSTGLFNVAYYDLDDKMVGCMSFSENDKDAIKESSGGSFGASRAFGVMTLMSQIAAFLILYLIVLFLEPRPRFIQLLWRAAFGLYIFACLTQLFTFSAFATDDCDPDNLLDGYACGAGAASGLAIVNVFLIITIVVLFLAVPPPPNPVFTRWENRAASTTDHDDYHNHSKPSDPKGDGSSKNVSSTSVDQGEGGPHGKTRRSDESEDSEDYDGYSSGDSDDDDSLELQEGETCEVTREEGPDGTKVTKTITHLDGSKTIKTEFFVSGDDSTTDEVNV